MRSKSVLFALWMLVTVVAGTVAWQSLGLVGASIDDQDTAAPTLPSTESDEAPTSSTTSAPAVTGTVAQPVTAGRNTDPSNGTRAPESSSSSSIRSTTTTTEPAIVELFTTEGGQAEISFSPTKVEVLWAVPAPGWEARSEVEGDGVKVEFRGDDERYRIDAWWDGGPQNRIREDDDDDD